MIKTLENPFYYLENFHKVLECIGERYSDLLTLDEQEFLERFPALPQASRALLVRMVMRKGERFRSGKLAYHEIGNTHQAAGPLVDAGWVVDSPMLTIEQLFGLLKKSEIADIFRLPPQKTAARKAEQLEALRAEFPESRPLAAWHAATDECVYQLLVASLCDRLRLMFFGNLHQDWSEFVLSDLGIFRYEKVEFSASSRGFRIRRDVDDYLHLHQCRERFREGESPAAILPEIPATALENDWLESRRARFLFQIAQHYEQIDELPGALAIYRECRAPGSRTRAIRVLERSGQVDAAFKLAREAERAPESEAEKQQLLRILPRLRRKLGQPKIPVAAPAPVTQLELILPRPGTPFFVEGLVGDHLTQADAPVLYVENALINSLFGLLCWDAVFAAVPGAFFHPFHTGPADLLSADFHRRRQAQFAACLSQLDSDRYLQAIRARFREKAGIQSPFVFWGLLTEELLELALACIPASHLKQWFGRILLDIPSNRAGFPDLIQFWPRERRYRMIEVKGPGDRLQDNQLRWLDFFAAHDMPVAVCYVQWAEDSN